MRKLRIVVTIALSVVIRQTAAKGCSIPLEPTRTSFVAAVRIANAGPFRFLFDTGTSQTVIDSDLARRLGVTTSGATTQAITASAPVEVQRAVIDDVRAGEIAIPHLDVLIASLPRFKSHGHIDGILGMDFVAKRSFVLDVARRCVDVDVTSRGKAIPATEIAGRVALRVDGLNFTLDSAASFVVLLSQKAAALAVVDDTIEMTSTGGRRQVPAGTIPRLRFGDVSLHDVPAVIASPQSGEDALLPVTLFSSVYVAADRRTVSVR